MCILSKILFQCIFPNPVCKSPRGQESERVVFAFKAAESCPIRALVAGSDHRVMSEETELITKWPQPSCLTWKSSFQQMSFRTLPVGGEWRGLLRITILVARARNGREGKGSGGRTEEGLALPSRARRVPFDFEGRKEGLLSGGEERTLDERAHKFRHQGHPWAALIRSGFTRGGILNRSVGRPASCTFEGVRASLTHPWEPPRPSLKVNLASLFPTHSTAASPPSLPPSHPIASNLQESERDPFHTHSL